MDVGIFFDIIVLVLVLDDEGSIVVIDGFIFWIFFVDYGGSVGLESGGSVVDLVVGEYSVFGWSSVYGDVIVEGYLVGLGSVSLSIGVISIIIGY